MTGYDKVKLSQGTERKCELSSLLKQHTIWSFILLDERYQGTSSPCEGQ